jgi:hypothetical protein
MSALDRVRENFRTDRDETRKARKSPSELAAPPSAGSAGARDARFKLFLDLEPRLIRMADRWRYTPSELTELLERASLDPAGWLRAVALDERREAEFRERGLLS